jgi:DNA-binding FadR family transcriptional regulator
MQVSRARRNLFGQVVNDLNLRLISEACEEMERTADSVEDFLAADIRFHVEIPG